FRVQPLIKHPTSKSVRESKAKVCAQDQHKPIKLSDGQVDEFLRNRPRRTAIAIAAGRCIDLVGAEFKVESIKDKSING
ncbi:hypothetical protein RA272_30875, partial [Pseudomonas syringae pv. tagetis]|uniref:hypothetical protein n=1 Tax=Pseudomonas syringae group genomosp. 7 TaxID=251699 RepID=UPI0037700F6B